MPMDPLVARAFGPRGRSYTALQTPFFSWQVWNLYAKTKTLFTSLHAFKDGYSKMRLFQTIYAE